MQTKNILVVEDAKVALVIAQRLLQSLGYLVDTAETGQQAYEKIKANTYDLVFMDLGLPDTNGIDVTEKLEAEMPSLPPMVALTTHGSERTQEVTQETGMLGLITKPLTEEKIEEAWALVAAAKA